MAVLSTVEEKVNELVGKIDALIATVEDFSDNKTVATLKVVYDWLMDGGQFTMTFDLLDLLWRIIPTVPDTFEKWLTSEFITSLDGPAMQKIEFAVKESILAALTALMSCEANPIIPDELLDGGDSTDGHTKKSQGQGFTFPLQNIDLFGSLYTAPTDVTGQYCYFDIRESGKTLIDLSKDTSNTNTDPDITKEYFENLYEWDDEKETFAKVTGSKSWLSSKDGDVVYFRRKNDRTKYYVHVGSEDSSFNSYNKTIKVIYDATENVPTKTGDNQWEWKTPAPNALWKVLPVVDINTLWQSFDFNAFLWYVINRGTKYGTARYKCVWDNRYDYEIDYKSLHGEVEQPGFFDSITPAEINKSTKKGTLSINIDNSNLVKGKIYISEDDYNNFIETVDQYLSVNSYGVISVTFTSKISNGSKTITYKVKSNNSWKEFKDVVNTSDQFVDTKRYLFRSANLGKLTKTTAISKSSGRTKKQLAYFEYVPGNGLGDGSIKVLISDNAFYHKRKIGNLQLNKFFLEWDAEYLASIKLYEPASLIGRFIDSIFNGLLGSATLAINSGKFVISQTLRNVITKVIQIDDTKVNDCYFTFTNDEYNEMLENAELVRRGLLTSGSSATVQDIINAMNSSNSSTAAGTITSIANYATVTEGTAGSETASLDMSILLQNLLTKICTPFIEPLLSPKIVLMFLINIEYLGIDLSVSFEKIMSILVNCIKDIVIYIKDMIVEMVLSWITKYLNELMEKVLRIYTLEKIERYREILENLLTLLQQYIAKYNKSTTIADVRYAEITGVTETSTDATTDKC